MTLTEAFKSIFKKFFSRQPLQFFEKGTRFYIVENLSGNIIKNISTLYDTKNLRVGSKFRNFYRELGHDVTFKVTKIEKGKLYTKIIRRR